MYHRKSIPHFGFEKKLLKLLLDANALAISLSSASILDEDEDEVEELLEDDDSLVRLITLEYCFEPFVGTTLVTLVRLEVDVRLVDVPAAAGPDCCCCCEVPEVDVLKLCKSLDFRVVGLLRNASGVIR